MRTPFLVIAFLAGWRSLPAMSDPSSDAPENRVTSSELVPSFKSYADALATWRQPEDVNAWIGAMFEYDIDRAVALSESQRGSKPPPHVFEPEGFFENPAGVCVDLARFAVETLRKILPGLKARYLMIEFEPAHLRGQTLRRHWVVVYEGVDGLRVFADSKRPGVIVGPYGAIDEFVVEYARFRKREIVAYREQDSYQRKRKTNSKQMKSDV